MLDQVVKDIQRFCNDKLKEEELYYIREQIVKYGLCCLMDSKVAQEVQESTNP